MSEGVIILGDDISEGAFGKVVNSIFYHKGLVLSDYEGEPLESSTRYAVKVPKGEDLRREIETLRYLGRSPYIIRYYGKATLPNLSQKVVMVMELLLETLAQRMESALSLRRAAFPRLMEDVFKAVAFLDSKNIVHRDLHKRNIMFGNSNVPKLIDFGLAGQVDKPFLPFNLGSDEHWRVFHPPEQRMEKGGSFGYGKCTRKFDVYSVTASMIEYVHDPTKNQINAPFHYLIRCALLRSDTSDFTFKYLDTRNMYPTPATLDEDIIVESSPVSDVCTYFRLGVDGLPKLVLHMPLRWGNIVKKCLMFDSDRPTAQEVVDELEKLKGPPKVLARSFDRGRGGRGLPLSSRRGRGRGRGLARGKRKRLRF